MEELGHPPVLRHDHGATTWLTLNRPDKRNALNAATIRELSRHISSLAREPEVACVVVAGEGRSFSTGHDLAELGLQSDVDSQDVTAAQFASETIAALHSLPQPTIARIHGHCLTGGLELALACDVLVCADDAILGDTHSALGLLPFWGMSRRLPDRVGRSRALELMLSNRLVTGREAAEMGLVDRSCPADELDAEVRRLTDAIDGRPPHLSRAVKGLVDSCAVLTLDSALEWERSLSSTAEHAAQLRSPVPSAVQDLGQPPLPQRTHTDRSRSWGPI